ncbi:MAG: tetratricopeptide repeat protein [Myxococcota bacterium]
MSAAEPSPAFLFDSQELRGLIDYLWDCPGRISAAAVSHARMGDELLERLRDALGGMAIEQIGREGLPEPTTLGHAAEARSAESVVLALRLDRHWMQESMLEYFTALNYQRERLAQGQVRMLLVMTHGQAAMFGPGADDLWDWTLRFRFVSTTAPSRRASRDRARRQERSVGSGVSALELASAADQLRRARSAGLDEIIIARDYALPYLETLLEAGRVIDAERVWERELREGEACNGMERPAQMRGFHLGFRLALESGRLSEAGRWSQRLLDATMSESEGHAHSLAHDTRGDYLQRVGDLEGAKGCYERALEVLKRLAEGDPSNSTWQRDLSISYEKVGNVARGMGDLEGARGHYERALGVSKCLAEEDSSDSTWQRDLSISYDNVGDIARDMGDLEEARGYYERALRGRERLVARDPANSTWQRDLTVSYDNVGNVARDMGDLEGARGCYENALVVSKRLADGDPTNSTWQRDLAISLRNLGDVTQQLLQSLDFFTKAVRVVLKIDQRFPTDRRNLYLLSIIAGDIAQRVEAHQESLSRETDELLRQTTGLLWAQRGAEAIPAELRPWLEPPKPA